MRALLDWLDEYEPLWRIVEVIAILTGAIVIGIFTVLHDQERNDIMVQQRTVQSELNNMIKSKTDASIVVALVAHICSESELRHVTAELLTAGRDLNRERIADLITGSCKGTIGEAGFHPAEITEEAKYNEFDHMFVRQVNDGRTFYRDHLWEKAAQIWNKAVVPPFFSNNIVNRARLAQAQDSFKKGQILESADLFNLAFEKIPDGSR